jgi:plastin-1
VNAGADDFLKCHEHIILGVFWQVIVFGLLSHINSHEHPEILKLMEENENLNGFLNLPPESTILRWFNYHLAKAGHPRRVNNFTTDISDGENYLVLLSRIAPNAVNINQIKSQDPRSYPYMALDIATKIGVQPFVTPQDIITGNKNLNMAFTADMFNKFVGIPTGVDDMNQQKKNGRS